MNFVKKSVLGSAMFSIVFSLAGLGAARNSGAKAGPAPVPTGTTLECHQVGPAEYDGAPGTTELRLLSRSDRSVVFSLVIDGIWKNLGFDSGFHRYILVGAFQEGAWLPFNRIAYFDEASHQFIESKVNSLPWQAFAAVPCDGGRFVILVGEKDSTDENGKVQLLALDTARDAFQVLGDPPAPPPLPADEESLDLLRQRHVTQKNWTWPAVYDGLVEMDEGIISCKDNVVQVSYGGDSPTARSKTRTSKRFELGK